MTTSPPTPPSPATPATRKGLTTLQWVLIVLGSIFVLMTGACVACGLAINSFIGNVASDFEANPAKAAAEMAVRMNPELELVSSDDDAGTMTVRNKETGEEITLDFSDIADGSFSFRTEEGEMSVSAESGGITAVGPGGQVTTFGSTGDIDLPAWVERYPGAETAESGFASSSTDEVSGMFTVVTDDAVDAVTAWYRERLEGLGYEVQVTTASGPEGASSYVVATLAEPERSQTVVVSRLDGRTQVAIQYGGKP